MTLLLKRFVTLCGVGIRCNGTSSTIFALSSGGGKCGVAVIRVSGPRSAFALTKMVRMDSPPVPRKAVLKKIRDPVSSEPIDKGLVLWFPGPRSFTGEDSCEFHVHGGIAVVQDMLGALGKVPGLKMAEPGEFTKRAFYNGKLDLTEVEGLADLIQAETEAQRKQALNQMEGALSRIYNKWTSTLTKCLANAEAYIDFGEDENIEDDVMSTVEEEVTLLLGELQDHLRDDRKGERLRSGVKIAIIGEPNVGKSSLLNLLCRRQTAIVSPIPGTTRDVLESCLNLGGFPVILWDTAGIRESLDPIEIEGVKRARSSAQEADLVVLMFDASQGASDAMKNLETSGRILIVANKVDLLVNKDMLDVPEVKVCWLSCKTEEGVGDFLNCLKEHVSQLCANPTQTHPNLTQTRHRMHLEKCVSCLENFLEMWSRQGDTVLMAEELRKAVRSIGKITGRVSTEDILDLIFKEFCIGK